MRRSISFLILIMAMTSAFAQNPKKNFSAAEKFMAVNDYKGAIAQYTEAIGLDPQMDEAYLHRAIAYAKNQQPLEALEDYRKMKSFKIKDKSFYYDAALICYQQLIYPEALEYVEMVLDIKKKKFDGLVLKTQIQMAMKDYFGAIASANLAIEMQNRADLHFFKACSYENANDLPTAEKEYLTAISLNASYVEALVALARLQIRLEKNDKALANCNSAIAIDSKNKDAYVTRAEVYVKMLDYPSAINDMSRVIMLNPDDYQNYLVRGAYYQQFTQHQNAINDFSKVILLNDKQFDAYYKRAYSYEQIANYPLAVKDYKKLTELSTFDGKAQELLEMANKRLFELKRESGKPQVVLTSPKPTNNRIVNVAKDLAELKITGLVLDESDIKSLQVNKVDVPFEKAESGVNFSAKINSATADSFYVSATDVYDNTQEIIYVLNRTEINPPQVTLMAPYASDNGEVFLDKDLPTMYVEGQIADESLINTIFIDGVLASFKVDEFNPRFIATININNKTSFIVTAKDINGNTTDKTFTINRDGISQLEANPMGRTWAVFVENSNYNKFPTLDGPARDVTLMRSALAGYDIQNILHKKNMSKTEMERFFSIELRDLLKSNNVRSVLIWYAGHGKFVNETGYWIPIDANRDDEFSYFSISSLKASMQSYSGLLAHTLIVTDACESGPTFYQAMRGEIKERSCNDWEATKLKSSQVFTSAGYELAIDNSQFTKTFANMLANNPNSCIPIESIVLKVTQSVSQNNQQKPKFGKIAGLGDEDGTFFFMNNKK